MNFEPADHEQLPRQQAHGGFWTTRTRAPLRAAIAKPLSLFPSRNDFSFRYGLHDCFLFFVRTRCLFVTCDDLPIQVQQLWISLK